MSPQEITLWSITSLEKVSSSVEIHVQTPFDIPEDLDMTIIATARDGVHAWNLLVFSQFA